MNISSELLAEYAEGNVTQQERDTVRQYLMEHPEDLGTVMMAMDEDYELAPDGESADSSVYDFQENLSNLMDDVYGKNNTCSKILPINAMAAQNTIDNLCVVKCEAYTLRHFGYEVSDDELLEESVAQGWQHNEGTALYNIGRLCGKFGLNVATHYNSSINDIDTAINRGDVVIAVVNCDILSNSCTDAKEPNHAVIVTSVNQESIDLYDPATPALTDTYPISQFINAWKCSSYNLVIVSNNDENYEPHPLNLTDVELAEDLIELREAIAENAHEVWAYNRKKEGWTYGPVRDDEKKTNPDLVPYNRLPESEKLYDREMAMNTIKLLNKLGWEIRKKQ